MEEKNKLYNILESFCNLNISKESFNDISALIDEKLVDVVNRAMRKGTLPPFKKGTKLTTYHVKNKRNDKIVDGDKSAELFVKAEGIEPSDSKISDKQLNRELNNTPRDAYPPLISKLNGKKLHLKGEEDLNGDKMTTENAVEKRKGRSKMSIFESLENLNVSEECFDDIMGIVEDLLSSVRKKNNLTLDQRLHPDEKAQKVLDLERKAVGLSQTAKVNSVKKSIKNNPEYKNYKENNGTTKGRHEVSDKLFHKYWNELTTTKNSRGEQKTVNRRFKNDPQVYRCPNGDAIPSLEDKKRRRERGNL